MAIAILYATREGQARKVADHIGRNLRARGLGTNVADVLSFDGEWPLGEYAAALLVASVHYGGHEREMVRFVKRHRRALESIPAAFLSVSGSQATVEMASNPPEVRARAAVEVKKTLDRFIAATGWTPQRVQPVAGAMLWTKYNFVLRFVIRMIARKSGTAIDVTRDQEFTDWDALDHFLDEFLDTLPLDAIPIRAANETAGAPKDTGRHH